MSISSDILMDSTVYPLACALSRIPGIRVTTATCGNGDNPLRVWFTAEGFKPLAILTRAIDPRYGGMPWIEDGEMSRCWSWTITVESMDTHPWVDFSLHSGPYMGEDAYAHANRIIDNIDHALQASAFLDGLKSLDK